MNALKKLAGQTAIYGLGSILGRTLNYFLVPLHTNEDTGFGPAEFGVVTEMYAYVAFLVVLLLYGLETSFFRFVSRENAEPQKIYASAVHSLITTTGIFVVMAYVFQQDIADFLRYPNHTEYVVWFALIVGLDACAAIPMARLRQLNKPGRFVLINLSSVAVNIGLNLFWILYCRDKTIEPNFLTENFYDPSIGVGYIFIANLAASGFKFLLLLPDFWQARVGARLGQLREMLIYGLPLMVAGFAGIINEVFDRILLKQLLLPKMSLEEVMFEVGVYGACYKLSIILNLFLQAFRMAAEPFFFAQHKENNSKTVYVQVMTYFVIVVSLIFLMVVLYLDFFKYFVPNPEFWPGLKVVPILLMANLCLGIYYNQSIWYKLSNQTRFGAYIALIGAGITIAINILLIPSMGYMGAAWATLICYGSMVLISYFLGQKHYPIPYNLKRVFTYLGVAVGLYAISSIFKTDSDLQNIVQNTPLFLAFIALVFFLERQNFKKFLLKQT